MSKFEIMNIDLPCTQADSHCLVSVKIRNLFNTYIYSNITCRTPGEFQGSEKFASIPAPSLLDPGAANLAVLIGAGFSQASMMGSKVAVLRTGDMGVMNKLGVAYVGRSDLVAKISGTIPSFSKAV